MRDRVSVCGVGALREAAAHLNFLRGFEYDPTVDCDAIVGYVTREGKECAEKGKVESE